MNKPEDNAGMAQQQQQMQMDQKYGVPEQEIVSGMDQMRLLQQKNGKGMEQNDSVRMLQSQIHDLTKFQNRLKQFDERPKGRLAYTRNANTGAQSARGIRTEPTLNSMASQGSVTARGPTQ